jgi:hypothetical protein
LYCTVSRLNQDFEDPDRNDRKEDSRKKTQWMEGVHKQELSCNTRNQDHGQQDKIYKRR